jgi:hypothetical protein
LQAQYHAIQSSLCQTVPKQPQPLLFGGGSDNATTIQAIIVLDTVGQCHLQQAIDIVIAFQYQ